MRPHDMFCVLVSVNGIYTVNYRLNGVGKAVWLTEKGVSIH